MEVVAGVYTVVRLAGEKGLGWRGTTATTTWGWAPLVPGLYGLPEPALVLSPWSLTAHEPRPGRVGFRVVRRSRQWSRVRPAVRGVVLDLRDPDSALLLRAEDPAAVDPDAIAAGTRSAYEPGRVRWVVPAVLDREDRAAAEVYDLAHRRGRVWQVTGDLEAWWAAGAHGPDPDSRSLPEFGAPVSRGCVRRVSRCCLTCSPTVVGTRAAHPTH